MKNNIFYFVIIFLIICLIIPLVFTEGTTGGTERTTTLTILSGLSYKDNNDPHDCYDPQ